MRRFYSKDMSMQTVNKQIYLYSGILTIITCAICGYFNWKISTGILIGMLCSFAYFKTLNASFKISEDGTVSKGGLLGFFLRIILIALPLFISVLLPEYFNIFGAFAGVMLFRIVMMFMFFKQKGEI